MLFRSKIIRIISKNNTIIYIVPRICRNFNKFVVKSSAFIYFLNNTETKILIKLNEKIDNTDII